MQAIAAAVGRAERGRMAVVPMAAKGGAAEMHRTALRLRKAGDAAAARAVWRRVLAIVPSHHDALLGMGELALDAGDCAEAARYLADAAASGSVRALVGLALAQRALGRSMEALASAERALEAAPDDASALSLAGALLLQAERFDEAEKRLAQAARRLPAARANLAALLLATDRVEEAVATCRTVLHSAPVLAAAWSTLGAGLLRLGKSREAAEAFEHLVELEPASPEARMARGMALLRLGSFEEGWRDYAWRWKSPRAAGDLRRWNVPPWDGMPSARRLILFSEQGFGDTLQFCRYAPLLAARGHEVTLEVQPELAVLLRQSFPSRVSVVARAADGSAPVHADAALALLDLPMVLGTTLETIPSATPYLRADPAVTSRWRARLEAATPGRLRVGIVWAGSTRDGHSASVRAVDARRSVRLAELRPLSEIAGIALVSLQKGAALSEIENSAFPILDWTSELADFAATASLVEALDLVVTVDTAVAHLAGGLGKETLLLSRLDGCWRWLTDRDDSPWYPSMRILRQGEDRSWNRPIAEAAAYIERRLRSDQRCTENSVNNP
jgi:Flp pilus assembly protein TadD